MQIAANYTRLREEISNHVTIVLAGKTRSAEEIGLIRFLDTYPSAQPTSS